MKTLFIITILMIGTLFSFCQNTELAFIKTGELIGYAKSAERYGDVYSAIDYYAEYYGRNKRNLKITNKLADLYFDIKDYKHAKPLYFELYQSEKEEYANTLFNYAKILKVENKIDSAIACFEIYRNQILKLKDNSSRDLILYNINHEIEGCHTAGALKSPDSDIKVIPLNNSVNNAYKDYAPLLWNDSILIYSSLYMDTIQMIQIDDYENAPVDKFFQATLHDNIWNGGFEPPKPFFNLEGLSVSGGVISDDHKRFYFTASKMGIDGKQIGALYVSRFEKGEWKNPEKLNEFINLKHYTSCQPTIGKCYDLNLEVLYFISDRPGGTGGMDIWYTVYDIASETYFKPINAGTYINTPGNEISPFIDKGKTMYFSSDGLPGYGGYDIYKTIGELVNWIPSENIGMPLNSVYDDLFYSNNGNDTTGFLVSNRSESKVLKSPHCCFDIFTFNSLETQAVEISGVVFEADNQDFINILKGNRSDIQNSETSSNTKVELMIENVQNGEYIILQTDTTHEDGSFLLKAEKDREYVISLSKNDYNTKRIKFSTRNVGNRIAVMDPITIIPIENKPISIENIYFEFNKWDLNKKSTDYIDTTLLVIMEQYKDIVIEISAHTDGIGDENSNLELSGNRATSVVEYLVERGIDRSRIISLGYGEARPIAEELDIFGNDIPEARERNRRIEFRIMGIIVQ